MGSMKGIFRPLIQMYLVIKLHYAKNAIFYSIANWAEVKQEYVIYTEKTQKKGFGK